MQICVILNYLLTIFFDFFFRRGKFSYFDKRKKKTVFKIRGRGKEREREGGGDKEKGGRGKRKG